MIDPLLWLIFLFTYSDIECALLDNRRRFGISSSM